MIECYNSIKRHYCNALGQEPSNSFYQNFLLKKKEKKRHAQQIRDIFTSLICTSLQENDYSMNIDIYVVDGSGLNIDTLQRTI